MRFNSDGNLSAEPLVTLKGRPNASPFDLVAGRDGWSFLLANEVYTKPGGPAELPYLFLHRRTPAGQWETEGIELNVGAQPYIAQSRVLPAAGGAATVLLVLNEMNGIERLAQFEVAADGTASEMRTIATGETIRFDVIADADGTQSLVWERVEPSGPQPAGRWTYSKPYTTTDNVPSSRAAQLAPRGASRSCSRRRLVCGAPTRRRCSSRACSVRGRPSTPPGTRIAIAALPPRSPRR